MDLSYERVVVVVVVVVVAVKVVVIVVVVAVVEAVAVAKVVVEVEGRASPPSEFTQGEKGEREKGFSTSSAPRSASREKADISTCVG